MKVVVLGCGPAGLMAAQGAADAGAHQVVVISRKAKSALYGAQYLHRPIPNRTPGVPVNVSYRLRGDSGDYRRKVYGRHWSGTVSPEDLEGDHQAWDIRGTYDALWDFWEPYISDAEVEPASMRLLLDGDADLLVNSVPLPDVCLSDGAHHFSSVYCVAAGDAPALGIKIQFSCPDDSVICNGTEFPSWYRMSRVFGHTTVEWPDIKVPITTAARVRKPLATDCDCLSGNRVLPVGRYGRWEKGVLSHTAYFDTYKRVSEMLPKGSVLL